MELCNGHKLGEQTLREKEQKGQRPQKQMLGGAWPQREGEKRTVAGVGNGYERAPFGLLFLLFPPHLCILEGDCL